MNWLGVAGVGVCMAYSLLLYFIIRAGVRNETYLFLAVLPLLITGLWVAWRNVRTGWRPWVLLVGTVLVVTMLTTNAIWSGLLAADGLWHASMNIFMLWLFARTLWYGRVPLITGVARQLEGGELAPEVARYTLRVTQAWSLFFAAQLLCSAALLLFATLPTWSLFVNVLNAPLIALMFVVEYGVRSVLHPGQANNTIPQVICAFARQITAIEKK